MQPRVTARLALIGAGSTLAFPLLVVTLQVIQRRDYSPMRQAMSELALGRDGWLMTVAFVALAVGSALLARLMHELTGSRVATILLGVSAVLTAVSAFVHADGDTAKTTVHGQIHQGAGILTFIVILGAMFLVAPRLRAQPQWRRLGTITRVAAIAGVPAFFLVPILGQANMGLAQRVLVGLLIGWNVLAQTYVHHALTSSARGDASPALAPAG